MNADTIHWSGKNQLQYLAFTIGCTQALAGAGALDPQKNDASDPIVTEAITAFHGEHDLNLFADSGEALTAFYEWLPTWIGIATYVKRIENGSIRVSLTMPGKSGASISIDLSEDMVEGATQYHVNKTVLKLSDMARKAYLSLVDVRGGFGVQPSAAGEDRNIAAPGSQRYPVIGIVKSKDKGKDFYKVLCGEWTMHGVRVWDEVLKTTGQDFETWPYERLTCTGFATVKFSDAGKPEKVTSLEISY